MADLISMKKNKDFSRVYSRGISKANPLLAMYVLINRKDYNRVGINVSKKVGKSVVRNKVKRRIREIYRQYSNKMVKGYDIVIIARVKSREAEYKDMEKWMVNLLTRHKLVKREGLK